MHVEVHARAEALDRVELRRRRTLWSLRSASIKGGQRPSQYRVDLARKTRVAMNEVAQAFGQDEHPLAVRDVGQKVLESVPALDDRALGVARRAGRPALAGERHEAAVAAVLAPEAGDAEARDAALQEPAQGFFRHGVGRVGLGARARREIGLEVIQDGSIERAAGRVPRAVSRADGGCHSYHTIEPAVLFPAMPHFAPRS